MLGQLKEAETCYRQAVRLDPALAIVHSNLGNTLRLMGNLDKSAACYRQCWDSTRITPKRIATWLSCLPIRAS